MSKGYTDQQKAIMRMIFNDIERRMLATVFTPDNIDHIQSFVVTLGGKAEYTQDEKNHLSSAEFTILVTLNPGGDDE